MLSKPILDILDILKLTMINFTAVILRITFSYQFNRIIVSFCFSVILYKHLIYCIIVHQFLRKLKKVNKNR